MEENLTRPVPDTGRLDLKNDYVFKRIFAKPENNTELKELTEAILDEKIKTIVVTNPEISKNYKDEKLGVLDIRAYMNDDTIVNIEMQVSNVNTMIDRNITYSSRVIGEQLRIGDNYKILKRFIAINLLGENLLRRNSYHSIVHLKFEETEAEKYVDMGYEKEQEVLTYKVEYHYIELKKFLKKNPGISSKLEQWLWLIVGEEDKVEMVSKENKTIEKVVEDLDEMSADEKERWEAFNRKLAIWDYNVNIQMATEQGKEEGEEIGKKAGLKEGEKVGRKAGIEQGKKEEKEEMAKKLKREGINIEIIEKVTGLSKEKIESL